VRTKIKEGNMIDVSQMVDIQDMVNLDLDDLDDLIKLSIEAHSFLSSHDWCRKIKKGMFDRGWANVIAVFYFIFVPISKNIPDSVWVIVGDLPPAYIDIGGTPNGACAIEGYVMEMQLWVDAIFEGKAVDDLIPVNVPPKREYAEMLSGRLQFIKEEILSESKHELEECP
jgi:hypothetical protein